MGAFSVVLVQPFIETGLQRLDGFVELFAKGGLRELLQNGFVELLANTVGLRRLHIGFGVIDIVDRQQELPIGF